jgi:hypothetical protein
MNIRRLCSPLSSAQVLVFNRRLVGVRSDFLMLRPSKPSSPPVTVPAPVPGKKLQSGTSGGGSDSDARPGSSSSPRDDSAAALAAFLSKDLGEGPDAYVVKCGVRVCYRYGRLIIASATALRTLTLPSLKKYK